MPLFKFKGKSEASAGLPVYKAEIDPSMTSDLEVNFIGLVDHPAIEKNFQAFNKQKQKAQFALDEDRHIISGPAMIADMPLYRKDDQLGEYYVVFDKPAIQAIVEKFSAKGFMQKFNLFHDDQQKVSDVTIFNSFIVDRSLGVKPPAESEDAPDGSWFISAKVNNPDVWKKVKDGTIKGFSVEGLFAYTAVSGAPHLIPQPKLAAAIAKESATDRRLNAITAQMKQIITSMPKPSAIASQFEASRATSIKQEIYILKANVVQRQQEFDKREAVLDGLLDAMSILISEDLTRSKPVTKRDVEVAEKARRRDARFESMGSALKEIRHNQ